MALVRESKTSLSERITVAEGEMGRPLCYHRRCHTTGKRDGHEASVSPLGLLFPCVLVSPAAAKFFEKNPPLPPPRPLPPPLKPELPSRVSRSDACFTSGTQSFSDCEIYLVSNGDRRGQKRNKYEPPCAFPEQISWLPRPQIRHMRFFGPFLGTLQDNLRE
jgi:hypothetical protein